MSELCTDNRFELIEKYKQKLIDGTNIEMAPDEMAVIDDILFRFWQMDWLDKLDADAVPIVRCKDCRWGKEVSGNIECLVNDYAEPMYHGYYWYCANGERKDDE